MLELWISPAWVKNDKFLVLQVCLLGSKTVKFTWLHGDPEDKEVPFFTNRISRYHTKRNKNHYHCLCIKQICWDPCEVIKRRKLLCPTTAKGLWGFWHIGTLFTVNQMVCTQLCVSVEVLWALACAGSRQTFSGQYSPMRAAKTGEVWTPKLKYTTLHYSNF